MGNISKKNWGTAFAEGKKIAMHVHALNRKLQKFVLAKPDAPPTDRELALGASVMVFWDYKIAQEASAAARRAVLLKAEAFFQEILKESNTYMENGSGIIDARRIMKGLRRVSARTEGEGFLQMWLRVERFLHVAQQPAYWRQEEFKYDPSIAIRALVQDLERVAQQGEEGNGETENGDEGTGRPEGQAGSEGDPDQADTAAMLSAHRSSQQPEPEQDGAAEGVRGGREGLETAPSRIQEQDQKPAGPGGQAPGGSEG